MVKNGRISLGYGHRLAEAGFHHRAQDHRQEEGRQRVIHFSDDIAKEAKKDHDEEFIDIVIQAINPDDAEENDQGEKQGIGNLQDFDPHADEWKVEDQKHDIADVHTGDNTPENVRMLGDKEWAGLDTMNDESS